MKGKNGFLILKAEIEKELEVLARLFEECTSFYSSNQEEIDSAENLRVIGSILHDFYTCIEKIFNNIALKVDQEPLDSTQWHADLLERMSLKILEVRPAIIDDELKQQLYEYLRFRHVFRNVYGFKLDWKKMNHLVEGIELTYNRICQKISDFFNFLEKLG